MAIITLFKTKQQKIKELYDSEEINFKNLKFNENIATYNTSDLKNICELYLNNSLNRGDFLNKLNFYKNQNKEMGNIIEKFRLLYENESEICVIKELIDFKNNFLNKDSLIEEFNLKYEILVSRIAEYKKVEKLTKDILKEISAFNLFVKPLKKIIFVESDLKIKSFGELEMLKTECNRLEQYMKMVNFLDNFMEKKNYLPYSEKFIEFKNFWLDTYLHLEYNCFDIEMFDKFTNDTLIFSEIRNIHSMICEYQDNIKKNINELSARLNVNKILEKIFDIQIIKLEEEYKQISVKYNSQKTDYTFIIEDLQILNELIFNSDENYKKLISPIKNTTNMLGITNEDDIKDVCDYYIYSLSKNIERTTHAYGNSKNISEQEVLNFFDLVQSKLYTLTNDQKEAVLESVRYLNEPYTANCLIQGDVSSGKTIVTVILMFILGIKKMKSVYIIPRRVLRMQHLATLRKYNELFNLELNIYDMSENFNMKDADIVLKGYSFNDNRFSEVQFDIGIIDEIQLFGVDQRNQVQRKYPNIDMFYTTATPHPRTKLISLIGNMDIIEIREMPPGRKLKNTIPFLSFGEEQIERICKEAEKGNVILVVCPLVNKKGLTEFESLPTAFIKYKELFPNLRVEQLRAEYSTDKQEKIIENVLKGKIDILIATKSIEVGIDIPKASVIVIHYPYVMKIKWGVSQLHQLRGRIGRNNQDSYCFIETPRNFDDKSPIGSVLKSQDVFELTKNDFDWRGFEKIIGTRQSGKSGSKFSQEKRIKAYEMIAKNVPNIVTKLDSDFIRKIENSLNESRIENLN